MLACFRPFSREAERGSRVIKMTNHMQHDYHMILTFSDGREGRPFLRVESNLLQCDQLPVDAADALVDGGIGPLPEGLQLLVGLQPTERGAQLCKGEG